MHAYSKWSSGARGYGAQIRCDIGREWKTRDQFSNGKLKEYDTCVRLKEATPEKSGISCKEHAPGAPAQTYQCDGPCNERRDIKFFSKNTRRKGVYWCSRCVEYQLTSEPGQYLPPPGAPLSRDEMQMELPKAGNLRDDMLVEWDDGFHEGPLSRFDAALSTSSSETGPTVTAASPTATRTRTQTNGNTRGSIFKSNGAVPPHLRNGTADNTTTTTTTSEVSDWQSETSTQQSGATTGSVMYKPAERQRAALPFNAWGPNGEKTRLVKNPTVSTGGLTTVSAVKPGAIAFNAWGPNGEQARMIKTPTVRGDEWSTTTADGERGDFSPTTWDFNDTQSRTTASRVSNNGFTTVASSRRVETKRTGWVRVRPENEPQVPEYLRDESFDVAASPRPVVIDSDDESIGE
ncbi:hypothetical protein B0T22DRAFT_255788 [Podospora appendiculata]|uniref:Stc1 domain-containing protein n=1 Tax=Podospora appendiculata TaxID=314037 RepID=A0AAE1C915_9PEZI|nr:hypothetical protein B0T22DRAFT_255788 [Podospora appendiculata]